MSAQSRSVYRPVPTVDAAIDHGEPSPEPPLNDKQAIVAMLAGFAVALCLACQWVIEARVGQ